MRREACRQEGGCYDAGCATGTHEGKLRKIECWDESRVREWADVAAEARRAGTKAHVGRIFEICVEKGSELPVGDPGRKYKGRVVYQGNEVKDERSDYAIFEELSSSPSTM